MNRALLLVGVLLMASLGSEGRAAPIVFGGPSGSISNNSGDWAWDGANMAPFRAALQNPANFGPGGTVSQSIQTVNLPSITPATLAGIDVFVSPWWNEAQSAGFHATITNWFLAGGSMLLYNDDTSHDGLGAALGVPTIDGSQNPSTDGAPLFNGPFGIAASILQQGLIGHLNAADILANGGTIAGVNNLGQPIAAIWDFGAYAPGAGRLVIVADVDTVSSFYGNVNYSPLNNNGRFALNTAAFLAQSEEVPEPASIALWSLVSVAGLAGWRRRRITSVS